MVYYAVAFQKWFLVCGRLRFALYQQIQMGYDINLQQEESTNRTNSTELC
jgi:hypothetical protein